MHYPNDLNDLLLSEIAELHSAETQLRLALPNITRIAGFGELQTSLREYLPGVEDNILRLEEAGKRRDDNPPRKFSPGMADLIDECESKFGISNPTVRDTAILGSLQKISHYKLAVYEYIREIALWLNLTECCEEFSALLAREVAMNKRLNHLAMANGRSAGMIHQPMVAIAQ